MTDYYINGEIRRRCKVCGEVKPLTSFRRPRNQNHLRTCAACERVKDRERKKESAARRNEILGPAQPTGYAINQSRWVPLRNLGWRPRGGQGD